MSPPATSSERSLSAVALWCGLAFAVVGFAVIGVIVLRPEASASPLAHWIVNSALLPQRMLPLLGLGVAFGMVDALAFAIALSLFLFGIGLGFYAQDQLLTILEALPQAPMHLFFTAPIASLAVGLALIAGGRLRPFVLMPAALVAGVMLALAIVATDPSLHDPTNAIAGTLIGLWIGTSVATAIREFRQAWFNIVAPILGSWLVAIGLLYGSAALLPTRTPLAPLSTPMPELTPLPDRNNPLPDSDRDAFPRDREPSTRDFRQP